jgi:hypothetical protein
MGDTPGEYLKRVRERLGVGVREVQEASALVSREKGNANFYIAASRLAQIENEESLPSIFKLFTLCAVYGLDLHDLLRRYGINVNDLTSYAARLLPFVTRPTSSEVYGTEAKVPLPMRLDPSFRWETTQLINRMVAQWGEVPAAFLVGANPRRHTYAYIGLEDRTMFPLVRPGSLLMVDSERRRVSREAWKDEFERPIYFVELREAYRCAWCQVEGSQLLLISHPHSGVPVESFNLGRDADVVGQVVGVAMRLVAAGKTTPEPEPAPLRQAATAR